jgi:mRNA interferase MazF
MKGGVVVIPFSDLSGSKKRPALVVATLKGDDLILCQITSELRYDDYSIKLEDKEFKKEGLNQSSMIRPNKIFTADKSIISYKIGVLKESKIKETESKIIRILQN